MMHAPRRTSAPLSERVWTALDEAVVAAARHVLAARRVATFEGPKGWDYLAVPCGTASRRETKEGKAGVWIADLVLLAEIRADFSLPWAAVEAFERGGLALDAAGAEAAAREVALAEDRLVLYGEPIGSGFLTTKARRVEAGDWAKPGRLVRDMLQAAQALDDLGLPGPYRALLAPAAYYEYHQAIVEGGYPAARQLKEIVADVHRCAVLRQRGAVFSSREGDLLVTVGGDLTVGYRIHDREGVQLFCVETVAGQARTPEAVCVLE
jgi:uncharacterized linocin/CFP29 family protein